eukprot:2550118-Rhodomonas_salina.3
MSYLENSAECQVVSCSRINGRPVPGRSSFDDPSVLDHVSSVLDARMESACDKAEQSEHSDENVVEDVARSKGRVVAERNLTPPHFTFSLAVEEILRLSSRKPSATHSRELAHPASRYLVLRQIIAIRRKEQQRVALTSTSRCRRALARKGRGRAVH